MEQSSELPPGIPCIKLSKTEVSKWNELPYGEEQAQPTLPSKLPAASVMETPQNVPWNNHSAPSQTDQTPLYSAFGFQRTDYDLQPRHNRFISFADTDFKIWARAVLLEKYKYSLHTRLYLKK